MRGVILDSLQAFCCAYFEISPSRVRALQYQIDITYLVAIARSFHVIAASEPMPVVWSTSVSVTSLFASTPRVDDYDSLCAALLAIMAFKVGPLETVLKTLPTIRTWFSSPEHCEEDCVSVRKVAMAAGAIWSGYLYDPSAAFNPSQEIGRIGASLPIHETLSTFPFDWYGILSSVHLSPAAIKSLLSQRPELREGDYPPLTEKEQALASELQQTLQHL